MQQPEKDGDLSNVKQELLELCKDASAWREQRRQAMKSRIFSQNSNCKNNSQGNTHHSVHNSEENKSIINQQEQMIKNGGSSCSKNCATSMQSSTLEKYIVEQLQTHKRKREFASTASAEVKNNYNNNNQLMYKQLNPVNASPSQLSSAAESTTMQQLSLKEKLLQKYNNKQS